MPATRYTSGDTTITVTGDLERQLRDLVSASLRGALEVLEETAEKVAENARKEWYGERGVRHITGESGDIQVQTTIDTGRAIVRVSVGSTDQRGAPSKPVPVFVHSPGLSSLRLESVDIARWKATPRNRRGPLGEQYLSPAGRVKFAGVTLPAIYVQPENAGKGHGMLLKKLVIDPTKTAVREALPKLAAALVPE